MHAKIFISRVVVATCVFTASVASAMAGAGTDELVGAKLVKTIKPTAGFVDSPLAVSVTGDRLAYVDTDGGKRATLHVVTLDKQPSDVTQVPLMKFTSVPTAIGFVGTDKFFVASHPDPLQPMRAAVLDSRGRVRRKYGPGTDIRLTTRAGKQVVVVYHKKSSARKVSHRVDIYDAISGRRVGKRTKLQLDATGFSSKLDFRFGYWRNDYQLAAGIKGGGLNAKVDQRNPDYAASYDLAAQKFVDKAAISNVIAHRKRLEIFKTRHNRDPLIFVPRMRNELTLIRFGQAATSVGLAEPFRHYKFDSFVHQRATSSRTLFSLTIDPVHPDAAAARRAVPKYLDLYALPAGKTQAVRRARLRLRHKRGFRWIATDSHWILVPRHIGFSRGGKELRIYKLDKA